MYKIILALLLTLTVLISGCEKKRCVCNGVVESIGKSICESVLEHCADDIDVTIDAMPFERPGDKYISIYFNATAKSIEDGNYIDPAYGYGTFRPYRVSGRMIGNVYISGYDAVAFDVINFGNWIDKKEMLEYGVPEKFLDDRHWSNE
jgi:hypothetical protein